MHRLWHPTLDSCISLELTAWLWPIVGTASPVGIAGQGANIETAPNWVDPGVFSTLLRCMFIASHHECHDLGVGL